MAYGVWECCGADWGDPHLGFCSRVNRTHQTIGKPIRDEHNTCIDCGYFVGHADNCFYATPRTWVEIFDHSPELTKPADGPKTLLDEIAIAAMQGMLAASGKTGTAQMTTNEISQHAYYQAKSMLAARARFGK